MRHLVRSAGLTHRIEVDSAGTIACHAGERPDARAREAARARGIDLSGRSRRYERADWDRFDYVIAMDHENSRDLSRSAPPRAREKLSLLLRFDPESKPDAAVPDPYYGGDDGFERVLDLCEAGCRGLLEHIRREHGF